MYIKKTPFTCFNSYNDYKQIQLQNRRQYCEQQLTGWQTMELYMEKIKQMSFTRLAKKMVLFTGYVYTSHHQREPSFRRLLYMIVCDFFCVFCLFFAAAKLLYIFEIIVYNKIDIKCEQLRFTINMLWWWLYWLKQTTAQAWI